MSTPLPCLCHPPFVYVGGYDEPCAQRAGKGYVEGPGYAASDHEHAVPFLESRQPLASEHTGQGLRESALLERDLIRKYIDARLNVYLG